MRRQEWECLVLRQEWECLVLRQEWEFLGVQQERLVLRDLAEVFPVQWGQWVQVDRWEQMDLPESPGALVDRPPEQLDLWVRDYREHLEQLALWVRVVYRERLV
ncbi:MAG: hypothetical protein K8R36_05240 [Planctomycetales bacterium]|nr:hypothetical protein [Planctomycetales bacterium]